MQKTASLLENVPEAIGITAPHCCQSRTQYYPKCSEKTPEWCGGGKSLILTLQTTTKCSPTDRLNPTVSSRAAVDGLAEYSKARHDFVPVQVDALQVTHPVWIADVALPPVQQAAVVKGHQVTWDHIQPTNQDFNGGGGDLR